MTTPRRKAVDEAMAEARRSRDILAAAKASWTVAHNRYNNALMQQPTGKRLTRAAIEQLWMTSHASYEALLDALRVHSVNLIHLANLRGKAQ